MITYPGLVVVILICFAIKALFGGFKKETTKPGEKECNNKMSDQEYDFWNDPNNWL